MTTNRPEAQQRADDMRVFNTELQRLETDGVLTLDDAQRLAVRTHQQAQLALLSQNFDIDRDPTAKQLSLGMRVASFVGAMNFLAAEALGSGKFRVSGTVLDLPHLENRTGRLGVRPEVIELSDGSSQALQGVVELVTYLGADQQVLMRVGPDLWEARIPNDQVFTRGQTVSLEVPTQAWLWLPS